MKRLRTLRAYAGAPLSLPFSRGEPRSPGPTKPMSRQRPRARYQAKYAIADEVFAGIDGAGAPEAGFFLWLPVPDGETAAVKLWTETGVRVMPGEILRAVHAGRETPANRISAWRSSRPKNETERGLIKIRDCLYQ